MTGMRRLTSCIEKWALITYRPYASRVSFTSKSLQLHASSTFTCGEYPCAGGGQGFYDLPRALKEESVEEFQIFLGCGKRASRGICSLFVVVIVVVVDAAAAAVTIVQIKAIKTRESRKRQGGTALRHPCPCNAFKANGAAAGVTV